MPPTPCTSIYLPIPSTCILIPPLTNKGAFTVTLLPACP